MARAHFVTYLLDSEGRPIPGAGVTVREPDTESLISETVYAEDDSAGDTELGNPFTAAVDGKCEIWLNAPKVVDLYVEKTGYEPSTIRATAHQLTASTLTVAEADAPLAQRSTLNFLAGFDLTDDAGNDETEIAIDLNELSAFTAHKTRHENGGADEISLAGLSGTPEALTTHESAFDHADIAANAALIAAVSADLDTDEAALAAHIADGTDAHDASSISVLDTEGLYDATNVEDALNEVELHVETVEAFQEAHEVAATDAHNASAISIVDAAGEFAATQVEAALAEIADQINNLQAFPVRYVRKSSGESVASSTVLQNDNELLIPVGANEVWDVDIVVLYISTSDAGDLKWDLLVPGAGGEGEGFYHCLAPGATGTGDNLMRDCTAAGGGNAGCLNAAQQAMHIKMLVTVGSSGGNLQFRWAQNTSNGTGTNVQEGSYIAARRVE